MTRAVPRPHGVGGRQGGVGGGSPWYPSLVSTPSLVSILSVCQGAGMKMRRGRLRDLPDLLDLEAASFEVERRDSPASIERSLTSSHQEVWLAVDRRRTMGAIFLRFWSRTVRIHSLAVAQRARGGGIGARLLASAAGRARRRGCRQIHLEADCHDRRLVAWYRKHGFAPIREIEDYYAPGWNALRMSRSPIQGRVSQPRVR